MSSELADNVKRQDLVMRRMFADAIRGPSYKAEAVTAEVFHETLALAHERNWIHPTRLARAVEASDSNTRKWFYPERTTPLKPVMAHALQKLSDLIREDAARIAAGKPTVNNTIVHQNDKLSTPVPAKATIKRKVHRALAGAKG
jgi:hypothetical protein